MVSERRTAASKRPRVSRFLRSRLPDGLDANRAAESAASRSMLYGWQTQHEWTRLARAALFDAKTLLLAWLRQALQWHRVRFFGGTG